MTVPLQDSLRWTADGTTRLLQAMVTVRNDLDAASLLPNWSRRHVVAHVAANAEALGNLVQWATTGMRTPMYASPQERMARIEQGTLLSPRELEKWFDASASALAEAWSLLDDDGWAHEVVTARGRPVPATHIPWLRAREVWVHMVDLDVGQDFDGLPEDFLRALRSDVLAARGAVPAVEARLADEVAWLTGRPHTLVDAPALPAWL